MILDDIKVVFFHVGKAAGSTVERVLGSLSIHKDLIHHPSKSPLYGRTTKSEDFELRKRFMMGYLDVPHQINGVSSTYLQHADIEIFKKIHGDAFDGFSKLTFVRNPYDRILSAYYYNGVDKYKSFKEFVVSGDLKNRCEFNLNRTTRFTNNHFSPQHLFTHYKGNKFVDFIGKVENFEKDFKTFLDLNDLEYNKPFPILAKTKKGVIHDHYMDAYDDEMKNIVYEIYKSDFKLFDYN